MRKLLALLLVLSLSAVAFSVNAQEEEGDTIADIVVAASEEGEFTILLTAVLAADPVVLEALSDPEGQWTVFAPTDAAFAELFEELGDEAVEELLDDPEYLAEILFYHVVEGVADSATVLSLLEDTEDGFSVQTVQGQYLDITQDEDGIFINDAGLVLDMLDIEASNGIIHVIDAVLLPEDRTIAEIVVDAASDEEEPEFTLLLAAVQAADPAVLEALSDEEAELTVFAPTDAAFEALGEDTLTAVLEDQELLTTILLYHVVGGVFYSFDVIGLLMDGMGEDVVIEMLDGSEATISLTDEGIFINQAEIIITDIAAVNGVIHVIDAVILPPME